MSYVTWVWWLVNWQLEGSAGCPCAVAIHANLSVGQCFMAPVLQELNHNKMCIRQQHQHSSNLLVAVRNHGTRVVFPLKQFLCPAGCKKKQKTVKKKQARKKPRCHLSHLVQAVHSPITQQTQPFGCHLSVAPSSLSVWVSNDLRITVTPWGLGDGNPGHRTKTH